MWIGLPLDEPSGTHVTIVIRHVNYNEEEFKRILHEDIGPLLPIAIKIHPGIVMRGYKNDVPTMDVEFLNKKTDWILKDIYRKNYEQVPEHTAYPELSPHVTVDTPERLKFINSTNGTIIAMHATLKKIGEKEIIDKE